MISLQEYRKRNPRDPKVLGVIEWVEITRKSWMKYGLVSVENSDDVNYKIKCLTNIVEVGFFLDKKENK